MKTIGLIGGMSWESTATYYQIINAVVREQLGGLHSAKLILYSVDFHEIEECQKNGEWEKSAKILSSAAVCLEEAGAEFIIICTNTMHKIAPQIQAYIHIPILHIAEATAEKLVKNNITTVALLGTKYTMTQAFYKDKLIDSNINQLKTAGAEAVILGCTEIGLLIKQIDCTLSVFDTTVIHAQKAAVYAIEK